MGMYLAHQLVGGVVVQIQQLGSNPRGREFRFLFMLEDDAFPRTHAIYPEDQVSSLSKIKIMVLMLNDYVHP
jgi:hypothetical protein